MTYVVVFDQGERKFKIERDYEFTVTKDLLISDSKYVYTDLFTGTQEQCEKFAEDRKLTIAK